MPANKKYLSTPFQRVLKISAGFIGGYLVMLTFHLMLTHIFEKQNVIITAYLTGYLLWAILLVLAFLAKNGWTIWGTYLILMLLFSIPSLFNQ